MLDIADCRSNEQVKTCIQDKAKITLDLKSFICCMVQNHYFLHDFYCNFIEKSFELRPEF